MISRLHALIAAAGLLACAEAVAVEQRIDIKSDPSGKHYIVERQGTSDNPVLVTKRVAADNTTHFMKRWFDCKGWKVRYLGEGPTLDAMNRGTPDPETSTIEPGSIPDHFARHACPPPHPAHKP